MGPILAGRPRTDHPWFMGLRLGAEAGVSASEVSPTCEIGDEWHSASKLLPPDAVLARLFPRMSASLRPRLPAALSYLLAQGSTDATEATSTRNEHVMMMPLARSKLCRT